MRALFYDTETTGLPLFKEPSHDPRQPHVVQYAASLVDLDTRLTIASVDFICKPDGWIIPDEVAAIHGITTERALDVGVNAKVALNLVHELWLASQVRIAHNEQFDARLVKIQLLRHISQGLNEQLAERWTAGRAECTQILSTPLVKAPPTAKMIAAGRNHYKSANLGEAYKHFTGKDLVGAHSARADVDACIEVYFAAIDQRAAA
jgi:DNA polymerase III subunit epsilon